jgi:hypothetical protein
VESAGVPTEVDTYSRLRHVVLPCRPSTVLRVRPGSTRPEPLRTGVLHGLPADSNLPNASRSRCVRTDGSSQPVEHHHAHAPGPPDPQGGAGSTATVLLQLVGTTGQARETDWRTAEARPSLHGDPTDARPRLAAGGTRDLFPGPGGSSSKPRPPRRLQKQKILTPERKNISNHAAVSVRFGRVKEGTHGIRTRLVGEGEKDP